MRAVPLIAAIAATVGGASLVAFAVPSSRSYRNVELRITEFKIPSGWEMIRPIGYPRVVVLAQATDGARLTLTVQRVGAGANALTLAADAKAVLERQHFTSARVTPETDDRVRLDAMSDGGHSTMRQEYVVDADLSFVLSVVSPSSHAAHFGREFDDALRSLVIAKVSVTDGGAP